MGVPALDRALHSATDALTLVVEDVIRPFDGNGRMREMHLHALPWPTEALLELGGEKVEMRVTLSYFIEPNPGVADGFAATATHRTASASMSDGSMSQATTFERESISLPTPRKNVVLQDPAATPRSGCSGRPPVLGFHPQRYLARHCRGPRRPKCHRRLSRHRMVEGEANQGPQRTRGTVRPHRLRRDDCSER